MRTSESQKTESNISKVRNLTAHKRTTQHPFSTVYKNSTKTPQPKTAEPPPEDDLYFYKNWARFADIMQVQPEQKSEDWANHLLRHLVPFVKGFQATLYIKTGDSLQLIGGYALNLGEIKSTIKVGENTIGQVAKYKEPLHIVNPQNSFTTVNTTQQVPIQGILTLPALYQNQTQGVLEILFYQPICEKHHQFLTQIMGNIGTNLCLLANAQLQQKNEELNEQLCASEEFRKLHSYLTEGLSYASHIQSAMMPGKLNLEGIFEDHFLIYEPKDIVSGDFYWVTQVTDELHPQRAKITFVAVVDCTGHGVPGAFVSIIGVTLLNEIVNQKRMTDPALILKMLNNGVRTRLKQSQGKNKDGMDVCLCKIEEKIDGCFLVTFAGAKRPLYYIQDKLLQKIKGDRQGIGGDCQFGNHCFTNKQITLSAGDRLFLSSDGYKDAANPRRKSLGQKKMENLLRQGHKGSMTQHHQQLLRALKTHQQGTAQRDDITLLGIQL
ncbi:hypothetical protein BKI52_10740 [marine bacterium AO1-C]|nr:hypothetical protein BKI52_10740 [marine bacterium AO1-C]